MNTENEVNICSKVLNLIDIYNYIKNEHNMNNNIIKNDKDDKDEEDEATTLINNIPELIIDSSVIKLYNSINQIKLIICNKLINQILENSPKVEIVTIKFNNIKTQLYPYQINNLNWMINIEKNIYTEEFNDIKKIIKFRGGGLFDEVGMGKTLQIITLINVNKSNNMNLIKNNKIYSKATLIIVPNHLCGQWSREFDNHLEKKINIINLLTKVHYKKYTLFELVKADVVIVSSNFFVNCKLNQHEQNDELYNVKNIFNKDVNIFNIYWYRVVIDEYHEIESSNLFIKLKYIESDYRWIISGTPFKEKSIEEHYDLDKTSLSEITDYLTYDLNAINKVNIFDKYNYIYIKNHFSRNTHNKNIKILKLPITNEEIVWLNFTETERMIYNAYLVDPNNTPYDVFLRQICCHPMISEKLRDNLSNKVESLDDIRKQISNMYLTDFNKADEQYNACVDRISRIKNEILEMEKEKKTNLIGYSNLKDELITAESKVDNLKLVRDGKEKTVLYYKKFIELLSDIENVKKEECTICLDNIKEEDLGITMCGHIYCYTCISTIVKENTSKCPNCQKGLNLDKIFLISKNKSMDKNSLGTKLAWLINYIKQTPNKYRIIFSQWDYLLKEVGKTLESNDIKNLYCQGNVYQKDKVLRLFNSKEENNQYKIIMLSSESTVSGSNLNNAEEVIFLDPVYGDKQHRLNTEKQAIGRVIRLGNKHEKINIIRILIKNSIEEEIYNSNKE
jgi:rubrerythrin